jgi:coenzyme F420-0:L-glutamate ligase/coenzyme F420-1:gamma-L-glutamate ligase
MPVHSPLILTPLENIPLVQPGDDVVDLILQALKRQEILLQDGDILVVTQKIVSKAEGRLVDLNMVVPSMRALELAAETHKDPRLVELILRESNAIVRIGHDVIIVEHRLGFVCANAGVDQSNIELPEHALLLPVDPDRSAFLIRQRLETQFGTRLGVLIIDSHGRSWRVGVVGISVGLSGIPGIVDLRGNSDLFDHNLRITVVAAADELAASASLIMGQANEGIPVVHVRGFPYSLREGKITELFRSKDKDLFR